jgi:hypothetical protein
MELGLAFLLRAVPSLVGFPISGRHGNAPGSFALDMQYTGIGCRTRLAIDISTRLSGAAVMWGWGGYLPVEIPNGLTLLSCFVTPE